MLVINQAEPLSIEDEALFEAASHQPFVVILNKTDLPTVVDEARITELAQGNPVVKISLETQEGIDQLEQAIADFFFSGAVVSEDATYVSNTRHVALLNKTVAAFDEVLNGLANDMPVDLVQMDMTQAWTLLGEITGDAVQDELLDQLFSQFCLGK